MIASLQITENSDEAQSQLMRSLELVQDLKNKLEDMWKARNAEDTEELGKLLELIGENTLDIQHQKLMELQSKIFQKQTELGEWRARFKEMDVDDKLKSGLFNWKVQEYKRGNLMRATMAAIHENELALLKNTLKVQENNIQLIDWPKDKYFLLDKFEAINHRDFSAKNYFEEMLSFKQDLLLRNQCFKKYVEEQMDKLSEETSILEKELNEYKVSQEKYFEKLGVACFEEAVQKLHSMREETKLRHMNEMKTMIMAQCKLNSLEYKLKVKMSEKIALGNCFETSHQDEAAK